MPILTNKISNQFDAFLKYGNKSLTILGNDPITKPNIIKIIAKGYFS